MNLTVILFVVGQAITTVIAITGWWLANESQNKTIEKNMKNTIRYEFYREILSYSQRLSSSLSSLSAKLYSPISMMKALESPKELVEKGLLKNKEPEAGLKYFNEKNDEVFEAYSNTMENYSLFLYHLMSWQSAIPKLDETIFKYRERFENDMENLHKDMTDARSMHYEVGRDWREWDERQIKEIFEKHQYVVLNQMNFLHDLMVLIHNELISVHFSKPREIRKTMDDSFEVLTENGFEVRVEDDPDRRKHVQKKIDAISFKTKTQ